MARANLVKAARKDYPEAGIKKGDSYWWWKFNFSRVTHRSKTPPTRAQLTQSAFLSELYYLEDSFEFDTEDLAGSRDDLISQIEELRDQCQDSLDNMPDHLQDTSDSAMLLQERIDALESWISDLENVDVDVDDADDFELDNEDLEEIEALPEDKQEARAFELKMVKRQERIDEIIEELSGLGSGL